MQGLYSKIKMRNRIKPSADKKGLKRPCCICENYFQPTGSSQRQCESCQDKRNVGCKGI